MGVREKEKSGERERERRAGGGRDGGGEDLQTEKGETGGQGVF